MPKRLTEQEALRRTSWKANCLVCGTIFGWAKNGDKAKYCSRVCAGKANGAISSPRGKLKLYVCDGCSKEFSSYHKNRKFCCKACFVKYWINDMPRSFAMRVDNNQSEIIKALTDAGASVINTSKLGAGFPDLIVGFNSKTALMEIKNPKTQYGRAGLTELQKKWHAEWKGGTLAVVHDVEGALTLLRTMK